MGETPMLRGMKRRRSDLPIHAALIVFAALTLLPFLLVLNNAFRTNAELYHDYFGVPNAAKQMVQFTWYKVTGRSERIAVQVMPETSDPATAAAPGATPRAPIA